MESRRRVPNCVCSRQQTSQGKRKRKGRCKRKRQEFVYNQEEEVWHEPYMQRLRKEFSDVSILCDSKIELPWRDIALPATGMRIRPDAGLASGAVREEESGAEDVAEGVEKKESSGRMSLPWQDLLITKTVRGASEDLASCDSTLEIPWSDLALDRPLEIRPPPKDDPCPDDVEIPWEDILIPRNIVIETQKRRRHPSSKRPPKALGEAGCSPCCTKFKAAKQISA